MVTNKINTLLIGLGNIGCKYDFPIKYKDDKPASSAKIITHARAISCHPDYKFIAGIDFNSDACKKFNIIYKNPTYSCIDLFLREERVNIDFVIIAVNPHYQPKLIEEVIEKLNPKVLLIEKPIAISMEETFRIQTICKKKPNLIVYVNYGRRYLPVVNKFSKLIKSGNVGKFLYGSVIYGKGLLTNGSHFLNLAQSWIGKLIHQKTLSIGKNYNDFDHEVSFISKLENNNSLLGVYSVGENNLRAGEIDLWFEGGRLCWLNNEKYIYFWPRMRSNSILESYDSLAEIPEITAINHSKIQFHVLDSIKEVFISNDKIKPICTLGDCVQTMALMNTALSSKIY